MWNEMNWNEMKWKRLCLCYKKIKRLNAGLVGWMKDERWNRKEAGARGKRQEARGKRQEERLVLGLGLVLVLVLDEKAISLKRQYP